MYELTVSFRASRPGERPKPYIHVKLTCPNTGKFLTAAAIVDTGADECAFPLRFAEILEIDLTNAQPSSTATAGGPTNSYFSEISLKAFADNHEIILPTDNVCFMENLHTPILGVRTFLKYFKFIIDYPNQEFQFIYSGSQNDVKIISEESISEVEHSTLGKRP